MHGSTPIVRNVSTIACQTTSKIPHLNFHILRRRIRNAASRPIHVSSVVQQQRGQSTTINLNDYRSSEVDSAHQKSLFRQAKPQAGIVHTAEVAGTTGSREAELERVEDVNFYTILEKNSPDLILLALSNGAIGEPFIRGASNELFDKAMLMLVPDYLVDSQKRIYRYMHIRGDEEISVRGLRQIEQRFSFYISLLQKIIALRHEGKHKLTLTVCTQLLKWAASLGHETLAVHVFDEVMKADGVEPDVSCYNYYMQAINWSNAYSQAEKFSLRVLPLHLRIRGLHIRPAGFVGHRTENVKAENIGVRGEILQAFKQLVEGEEKANALTFINVMTAMGREGDLSGVASILKSVWNIDLGLLNKYDEDEIESPTFYEENHPLRPTEELLFTLAHVFGSNNDARTAWTLVDYVSRSYAIPIPRHVWTELLEWYMVLCLRRGGAATQKGYASGQISRDVFEQLFSSMIDQPHNIQPDGPAYYLQSRVRLDKRHLEEQLESISGLSAILEQSAEHMRRSSLDLTQHISEMSAQQTRHLWGQTRFLTLRRKFITDALEFEACLGMTRHAVTQRLLRYNYWSGGRKLTDWERRRLPQLVQQFSLYLPQILRYRTTGGIVELKDPHRKDNTSDTLVRNYRWMTQLRTALDTDDHDTLLAGLLRVKEHPRFKQQRPTNHK